MTTAGIAMTPRRPRRSVVLAVLAASVVAGVVAGAVMANAGDRPEPQPTPSSSGARPTPSNSTTYPALPQSAPLGEDQFVVPRGPASNTRLYLAGVTGEADPRKLSTPKDHHVNSPTLSADRRTLIYVDRTKGRLRTIAVDGTGDQQLFDGLPARCDAIWHVSWSRADQTTLVIRCTSSDGPDRLMVIDLNGTVLRMLDDPHNRLDDPVISPDGQQVAYWAGDASDRPGGGGIFSRDIAGATPPQRLTRDVAGRDADPAWSPDGDSIAFRRRAGDNLDVYAMTSDGSDEHRVVGGPADDVKPLYSPNGRQLMIVSDRTADGEKGDTDDVYLVDVDGGTLEPLGLRAETISTPVWSSR